jgi:hypothetical protein
MEAPDTHKFFSPQAVDRLLNTDDAPAIAVVPPDFPFELLSGKSFITDEDAANVEALRKHIVGYDRLLSRRKGVELPPRLVVSPDMQTSVPEVGGSSGWDTWRALNELEMGDRPISLNSLAGDRWLRSELPKAQALRGMHGPTPELMNEKDLEKAMNGRRIRPKDAILSGYTRDKQLQAILDGLGPRDQYPADEFKLKKRLTPFKRGGGALAVLKD